MSGYGSFIVAAYQRPRDAGRGPVVYIHPAYRPTAQTLRTLRSEREGAGAFANYLLRAQRVELQRMRALSGLTAVMRGEETP